MPFGLCNAPQTTWKLVDKVIPHQLHARLLVYLDDLLVISATLEENLGKAKLTINVKKSKFYLTNTRYLGYVFCGGNMQVDPNKVETELSRF